MTESAERKLGKPVQAIHPACTGFSLVAYGQTSIFLRNLSTPPTDSMSTVSIRDAQRASEDRRWIESMYRDFLSDLAPQATGLYPALQEFGHSEPEQVLRWFADPHAKPLIITRGADPIGFATVRMTPQPVAGHGAQFDMVEFFIARPWRRRGMGQQAVRLILDRFAGRWEINEDLRNTGAVAFWRRVVSAYTQGRYQERVSNGEVHQRFDSGTQRPR